MGSVGSPVFTTIRVPMKYRSENSDIAALNASSDDVGNGRCAVNSRRRTALMSRLFLKWILKRLSRKAWFACWTSAVDSSGSSGYGCFRVRMAIRVNAAASGSGTMWASWQNLKTL
jgi:hypothetical protein